MKHISYMFSSECLLQVEYENEAFYSAIDLYKKGEVRIKDVKEINKVMLIIEIYWKSPPKVNLKKLHFQLLANLP